jgi:acyl-coenzyme A synthetase/AMP-(fatty) acid ligase
VGDVLPIGYPCRNTDVLVINEAGAICCENEVGELYVRGTSLALGYWNDKDRTDEVFVQNPLENRFKDLVYKTGDLVKCDGSGCITFLGRQDSQIKLYGYRIELGEIESAAAKINGVARNAAVLDSHSKVIVLFIESLPSLILEVGAVRRELAQFLPKYMIPGKVIFLDELKLNKNGKIDRIALLHILK